MNKKSPILLEFGFPNQCRPLNHFNLRAFTIGDMLRRVLRAGEYNVLGDIHANDLGKQLGSVLYYLQHHKKGIPFASIADVHKAYFLIKKIAQNSSKVAEKALAELLACQDDPNYKRKERDDIYRLFSKYVQDFMDDGDFAVDLYGKESDYLDSLKQRTEMLLTAGKASIKEGAVLMHPSPTLTQPPLMIRHQDGRYLYTGIDLEAVFYRVNQLKAHKILYIISGAQSTQMTQVFDAAAVLGVTCDLVHVKLGDLMLEGDNTPRNPVDLMKKIAGLPCPDITFDDGKSQKAFLYSVFKLHNLWNNPRFHVTINLDDFFHWPAYAFLKQFAFYRTKYHHLINPDFHSEDIPQMIDEVERGHSLVPVMGMLKKHMRRVSLNIHTGYSVNMLVRLLSILRLDQWKTTAITWPTEQN